MELKKILLLLSLAFAIIIPWYFMKYHKNSSVFMRERCDNSDTALIEMNSDQNKLNICNYEEFNSLIKALENYIPDLQFVHLLPAEEQYKIYAQLLKNYVIDPYIIKEFIKQEKIDQTTQYIKDYDLYLKIMETNFQMSIFQKELAGMVKIEDSFAEEYYNKNKTTKFAISPFTKEVPCITARAIAMDDKKKTNKEYEKQLKENKNIIPIDDFNPYTSKMNNSQLTEALITMKIGEYKVIEIQKNQHFMLYKISEKKGIWHEYNAVSAQVKSMLKKEAVDKKYTEKIEELKSKLKIDICADGLKNYINEKNSRLKEKEQAIDNSIDPLDEEEGITESTIKKVEQEEGKIN